ncbi:MAG: hypothetical protein C0459_13905 [Chitinophaga sp.]|jgi:hypothetical protein|nr:hypothetical protein [Chitinophaga sp.]
MVMQTRRILMTCSLLTVFYVLGFCQTKNEIIKPKNRFYFDYGYGINFYGGFSGQLSLNWITKKNVGVIIGSEIGLNLTKDLPADYHRGGLFNIANSESPHNILVSYSARYAKRIPITTSIKNKFIQVESGLSLIHYYKPTFIKDYNTYFFTSNYITSFDEFTSVGLSFKAFFISQKGNLLDLIFALQAISISICHI